MKKSLRKIVLGSLMLGGLPAMSFALPFPVSTPVYIHQGTQTMGLCENSSAMSIDSFLTITDATVAPLTETWTILTPPHNGHVTTGTTMPDGPGNITPSGFTYRPHTGFSGADSFVMQVSNGTNTATTKIVVAVNPPPVIYTFTGGGGYCIGGNGVDIGLTTTDMGVSYQLYTGATTQGNPVNGTGSAIDFDTFSAPGVYYAVATNTTTLCTSQLSGVTVSINQLPDTFTVTGGGSYCPSGTGVSVGLANSETGASYQLYNNGTAMGGAVTGSGSAITFGLQTAAGPFTVVATNNNTGCVNMMNGTAATTLFPLPTLFNVDGGGGFCLGDFSGLPVGLDSSEAGVNYQLLYGGIIPITTKSGTGNAINFGTQLAPGSYYVTATNTTTGCVDTMGNHVNVNVNIPPTLRQVTGGGSMCASDSGLYIDLSGSTAGVSYQLYEGSTATGAALQGTGTALAFGYITTAGTYTVLATDTTSGCTTNMTGSATVVVNPVLIPSVNLSIDPGVGNSVCYGIPVTFTAQTGNGGTTPAYVWTINGSTLTNTDSTYTYLPRNGDIVSVALTSNAICAMPDSAAGSITINVDTAAAPSVFISVSPLNSIAPGTSDTLRAVVTNGSPAVTYQWYKNGTLTDDTTSIYISSTFANNDSISCQVISNSGCGPVTTYNSVVITVYPNGVSQVGAVTGDVLLIPNPNKGVFAVKGTMGVTIDAAVSIEITDMLGQVVYRNNVVAKGGILDEHIALGNTLANGMYMLNLVSGSCHKALHFVIAQ